jgi:hypothetical protein
MPLRVHKHPPDSWEAVSGGGENGYNIVIPNTRSQR